ncbi:MAG TPA: flagellar basal-body MS-ring/collar protein FliF [Bryobacteraceae bacterium]|jgi:flagellar M-ring protein FliF|nr:flagellar basal-body MS-ring/collar protein FliF [Bryobacteraceae bacterium]
MDQLKKVFAALSVAQRVGIAVAVVLLVAGLSSFVHWRRESDFIPLFSGMPAEDAAAIVQKLKESGVEHRLTDNGTSILVPSAKVDEIRLEMAGAGLPRSGRIGFELFDKTNLGLTDFTEHINYRRALEGELERTIRSINEVEQARVHLSFPKDSVFLDAREAAKASVLLTLKPGARLSDSNVLAITNLVASAVEGLSPDFVSVVDSRGSLLSRPKKSTADSIDSADGALEYKHQLEKDLLAKVQATLTPLLGEDHFRVGISADCDFSTSELTDETFDPTHSVMTNSQKSEDVSGHADSAGIPGTSSNLPRPTSRPVGSTMGMSRRTENTSYETSRTVRQVKVPRGIVKRLSASILIDQEVHWEGTGAHAKKVSAPPSPERLKTIHDIVGGIIGLSAERGDQLIVQSLPFESDEQLDAPASTPLGKNAPPLTGIQKLLHDPKLMIGAGAGALLLVGLLVFMLQRNKKAKNVEMQAALPAPAAAQSGDHEVASGQPDRTQLSPQAQQAIQAPDLSVRAEKLRQSVRESVTKDPALAAGVIRSWIAEAEGQA